jgi:predicted dehydrogenase
MMALTSTKQERLRANPPPQQAVWMRTSFKETLEADLFHIALLIDDCGCIEQSIRAVANPISKCRIDSLTVIHYHEQNIEKKARKWLERYRVQNHDEVNLSFGEEGFQKILQDPNIDAVFVIVPTVSHQHRYVLRCLHAKKHVLLKDPVSTSYEEFMEQLTAAKAADRFVQFSTMFVHQYRVKAFLDCVSHEKFGSIESIDAILTVNYNDLGKVNVKLPLSEGSGCIHRLARYCVLISTLMLTRHGSRPVSAQVTKVTTDTESGEPVTADCIVHFSDQRVMTCHVGYSHSAPTRQVLHVSAKDRIATTTDFVIPHPDGLATCRVYDKEFDDRTGLREVVGGESLDVTSGPPQDVMMWRTFCQLCRSIEKSTWNDDTEATAQARELAEVAIHTKRILIALKKSYATGGEAQAISL